MGNSERHAQPKSTVDNLFDSFGNLKQKVRLAPDFLRPLYQYTSSEIRHSRELYTDNNKFAGFDDNEQTVVN